MSEPRMYPGVGADEREGVAVGEALQLAEGLLLAVAVLTTAREAPLVRVVVAAVTRLGDVEEAPRALHQQHVVGVLEHRPEVAEAVSRSPIAVLPFVDMSEARDSEYFSDGVTEEILNALDAAVLIDIALRDR